MSKNSQFMNLRPVTLEGLFVRLEPLTLDHHAQLCAVGLDPELWRVTTTIVRSPEDMKTYIETALQWQAEGHALPFVQVEKSTNTVVGSTRYAAIDRHHRRLEIGWTWIARPRQRTPINTEAKYLLLKHAFEELDCIRVEFKTDSINEQSRKALMRIGAREEGIFRNHMITPSGRLRHSAYYSIIDAEWPGVKARLEGFLRTPPVSVTHSQV
ncbi:MAG TPA: GNAT family protein [Bacteroidota bacterium]|nr:GNAT family protein [Bacteroidota bacterium]